MSQESSRPFSRFYADLLREAGEEVEERDRWLDVPVPKVANPRQRPEEF